jgi:hypothetical protein
VSLQLPTARAAWDTPAFQAELKRELESRAAALPLQQGVAHGGVADASNLAVSVFSAREDDAAIHAEVGVFFSEIVAGCSCGDDPMDLHAYCVMRVSIDKASAHATVVVLVD